MVPDGIDDPARPSGGNAYDRQVCRGLAAIGWSVHEHAVPGAWPRPDAAARAALAGVVAGIPDGAVVLLDGLVASAAPEVLVPQARRLRLVVLVHMPLGDETADDAADDAEARERAVLPAAAAVVTTSAWTRRRLLELYALPADRVHVAEPGVDAAGLAPGTATGGALLCVAAVTPRKGHDVLLDALATLRRPAVALRVRGQPRPRPGFVERTCAAARSSRASATGCASPGRVPAPTSTRAYAAADLLVLASRGRDVRHGRHRGAGARPAGRRDRRSAGCRRRSATRPTASGRACWSRPETPTALAAALRALARRRRAAGAAAPGRPRAARDAGRLVGHDASRPGRASLAGAAR